jgi:excisionase family DNA binding protein
MMDRGLTARQAAAILGYTEDHVCRLARWGRLRAERFGYAWVIDPEDVERLKSLQSKGGRLPKAPKQQKSGQ